MWLETFQEEKTETQRGVQHVTTQGAPPEGRGHVEKEIEPSGTSPRAKEHLGHQKLGGVQKGPALELQRKNALLAP